MVNKVILIGNLGQDPEEPRKTQGGLSVLDISIATRRRTKNDETTDWHTVTCRSTSRGVFNMTPGLMRVLARKERKPRL